MLEKILMVAILFFAVNQMVYPVVKELLVPMGKDFIEAIRMYRQKYAYKREMVAIKVRS